MTNLNGSFYINLDFSKDITINENQLTHFKNTLNGLIGTYKDNTWDDNNYWPNKKANVGDISQFFTIGNSINFRYWNKRKKTLHYCTGRKGGIDAHGAMYMWRALKICLDKQTYPILDAKWLSTMRIKEITHIFQDDNGNTVLPELKERLTNWNNLGKNLTKYWNGRSYEIIQKCNGNINCFVKHYKMFRAFNDPLYKMIMVNALMHHQRGITKLTGIIPGMDYQILKQLLRYGIIIPDTETINKISNYRLLTNKKAGDLRKAGLSVLYKIMNEIKIDGQVLDNIIWNNRKNCNDEKPVCIIQKNNTTCPFIKYCTKKTRLLIPLERTRYY